MKKLPISIGLILLFLLSNSWAVIFTNEEKIALQEFSDTFGLEWVLDDDSNICSNPELTCEEDYYSMFIYKLFANFTTSTDFALEWLIKNYCLIRRYQNHLVILRECLFSV